MKRKVIQIGESTQLISLPRQWAMRNSVRKGDELEIEERGGQLVVTAGQPVREVRRIERDVSRLGMHVTMKLVKALYKAGYDEISLHFSSDKELDWIHQAIRNNCVGMEIVEQAKSHVVAKKILDTIDAEFEAVFRRTLIFLNTLAADSLRCVRSGDPSSLSAVTAMDVNINKFSCFCRRVLNRGGHPTNKLAPPLYTIIEQIEETGDLFKKLSKFYCESGFTMDLALAAVFEEMVKFQHDVTDLLFKFDLVRVRELAETEVRLNDALAKVSGKLKTRELRAAFYLETALDRIWALTGPLLSYIL